MAMMTARKRAAREPPWSRAIPKRASARGFEKRPRPKKSPLQERSRFKCPTRSGGTRVRRRHQLGAAGRARAAHIMQLRPVGIEGPDEELAPEGEESGEWAGPSITAACRGGARG